MSYLRIIVATALLLLTVACDDSDSPGQAPDGGSSAQCVAQNTTLCSDDCVDPVGVFWDGTFCQPIICCCEGPDCDETYATVDECTTANATCGDKNACALAGGYCNYGDFVQPVCALGYGRNDALGTANPGVCDLGICCTLCPEPDDPLVNYVAEDPSTCAIIDFACLPEQTPFDSECGCGCIDAA